MYTSKNVWRLLRQLRRQVSIYALFLAELDPNSITEGPLASFQSNILNESWKSCRYHDILYLLALELKYMFSSFSVELVK